MSYYNDDKYNETKSVVLNLEILQQKYQLLLSQYKQGILDYISLLNDNENDRLTIIKGFVFNGSGSLKTEKSNNVEECSALCSNNDKCSGATFKNGVCLLRVGDSQILHASDDNYAIIRKSKKLLDNSIFGLNI